MKKIYYILFSVIILIGTISCSVFNMDGDENTLSEKGSVSKSLGTTEPVPTPLPALDFPEGASNSFTKIYRYNRTRDIYFEVSAQKIIYKDNQIWTRDNYTTFKFNKQEDGKFLSAQYGIDVLQYKKDIRRYENILHYNRSFGNAKDGSHTINIHWESTDGIYVILSKHIGIFKTQVKRWLSPSIQRDVLGPAIRITQEWADDRVIVTAQCSDFGVGTTSNEYVRYTTDGTNWYRGNQCVLLRKNEIQYVSFRCVDLLGNESGNSKVYDF